MIKLYFLVVIMFSSNSNFERNNDSLKISISFLKESRLKCILKANVLAINNKYELPDTQSFTIGYKGDSKADFIIEVNEFSKDVESVLSGNGDYQFIPRPKKYIFLKEGESLSYQFDISNLYRFKKKKKYKIRIGLRLANDTNFIYSNWLLTRW